MTVGVTRCVQRVMLAVVTKTTSVISHLLGLSTRTVRDSSALSWGQQHRTLSQVLQTVQLGHVTVPVVGWQSQGAGVTRYVKTQETAAVTGTPCATLAHKAGLTEVSPVLSHQLQITNIVLLLNLVRVCNQQGQLCQNHRLLQLDKGVMQVPLVSLGQVFNQQVPRVNLMQVCNL